MMAMTSQVQSFIRTLSAKRAWAFACGVTFVLLLLVLGQPAEASYLVRAPNVLTEIGSSSARKCSTGQTCGNVCVSARYVCQRPKVAAQKSRIGPKKKTVAKSRSRLKTVRTASR